MNSQDETAYTNFKLQSITYRTESRTPQLHHCYVIAFVSVVLACIICHGHSIVARLYKQSIYLCYLTPLLDRLHSVEWMDDNAERIWKVGVVASG